jgi:hypothetical protein
MSSSITRLYIRDDKTPPCRHSQPWRILLREYTLYETRHWPFKVLLILTDVACVNAFILWMLKYHDWQQKKNQWRCLYLVSLAEHTVRPNTRSRAKSGNVNRHICRAKRTMGVPCKRPGSLYAWRKMEEDGMEGIIFVQQLCTEKHTGISPVLRKDVQGPLYQDNSNNMWQLQWAI